MKKLAMALAIMFLTSAAHAMSWGEMYRDVRDQTKVTVLSGAEVGYFYSLVEGSDKTSQAGVVNHVFTYRFLSADVGWKGALSGKEIGTGIGGGSISFDKVVALSFPNYTEWIRGFVPESAMPFWRALYLGAYGGWDFDRAAFDYGLHSGLELKF